MMPTLFLVAVAGLAALIAFALLACLKDERRPQAASGAAPVPPQKAGAPAQPLQRALSRLEAPAAQPVPSLPLRPSRFAPSAPSRVAHVPSTQDDADRSNLVEQLQRQVAEMKAERRTLELEVRDLRLALGDIAAVRENARVTRFPARHAA